MKLKLALLLSIISFMVYPQSKSIDNIVNKTSIGVQRVYNDGGKIAFKTCKIVESLNPRLEKALSELCSNLKIGVDNVWNILVKQQLVWSICYLLILLSALFSWFHFWYRINLFIVEDKSDRDKYISSCLVTFIIASGLSVLSIQNFTDMLTGFINPEFGAMKTITEIAAHLK